MTIQTPFGSYVVHPTAPHCYDDDTARATFLPSVRASRANATQDKIADTSHLPRTYSQEQEGTTPLQSNVCFPTNFCRDTSESEEKSQKLRSPRGSVLVCVTVRTLCLLVSSVSVILSVARAVIHDMLHLTVHQECDPFQIIPQSHIMVMMSVPHLDMVAEP